MEINQKFKNLIPPLSEDERKQLEENILADGIRDPLVLWGDVLVDGHNRYEIAQKHNIEFRTVQREFPDESAAELWIIDNQFGRRNLSDVDRITLAQKKAPLIAEMARKRQAEAVSKANAENPKRASKCSFSVVKNNNTENVGKQPKTIHTRAEVAKTAGVSESKVAQFEQIQKKKPELVDEIRKGNMTIGGAYKEVRKQEILESGNIDALQSLYDESLKNQEKNVADTLAIMKQKDLAEYGYDILSGEKAPEPEMPKAPKLAPATTPKPAPEPEKDPSTTVDFQRERDKRYEEQQRQIDEDYATMKRLDAIFDTVRKIKPHEFAQAVRRRSESDISTLEFRIKETKEAISILERLLIEFGKRV